MNSVGEQCSVLKQAYDRCFDQWFTDKFLKGNTNDSECAELFNSYQTCVKKALGEKGIEMADLTKDVLGTEDELKRPAPEDSKKS